MQARRFDCVVIGAGPAGIAATARLARAGLSVVALEAGAFPGAENWSGAVYFTENLEHPTVFGGPVIEAAPYERRVARRGIYAYDGSAMLGARFSDRQAFRHCYTVLRPIYDRYLAEKAREAGAIVLAKTTAESLIRRDAKVVGVMTNRGPVYADVVFLAEGDASHLVTQEGYERATGHPPRFLQGVKEVLRLPPETIERRFGLAGDEGACFEFLIRNATRHGRTVRLNAGGFLYTNRDSVSLGFVLPLDNLRDHFDGHHHLLIEWVKSLPVVKGWIEGAQSASYGTKIIRGGGAREMPTLVDHGLAIGGAASGIGLDFPYPNFTGPATAMGQLFADAVLQLRREGAPPTRENLERAYLAPLERTHYVQNVRTLDAWPDYVERTTEMFASQVDLVGGVAEALSEPGWGAPRRAWEAVRAVRRFAPPLADAVRDQLLLARALHLPRLVLAGLHPACWGHWLLNIVRQCLPARRPADGTLAIELVVSARDGSAPPPWPVRWGWGRFRGAAEECFRHVYTNDRTPLLTKLTRAARAVSRRASLSDLLLVPVALVVFGLVALVQRAAEWWVGSKPGFDRAGWWARRAKRLRGIVALEDGKVGGEGFEAKLARNSYDEAHASHIKVLWPTATHDHGKLAVSALWSVCPAKVYERTPAPGGLPLVAVNFDNCIKCESCWRATPDVHWSRATSQGLVFETYAPAQDRLLDTIEAMERPRPRMPGGSTWGEAWLARQREGMARWAHALEGASRGRARSAVRDLAAATESLGRATAQLGQAIDREPRALDRTRLVWLVEIVRAWDAPLARLVGASEQLRALGLVGYLPTDGFYELVRDLAGVVATAQGHVADAKPFWAELLGRQVRAHHVEGVRAVGHELARAVGVSEVVEAVPPAEGVVPFFEQPVDSVTAAMRAALTECFTTAQIRALEAGEGLAPAARALLEDLRDQARTALEVERMLFELARVDPSVAYAAAADVHARRLLAGPSESPRPSERGRWQATALAGAPNLVPALVADEVVVCSAGGVRVELLAAAPWATPCRPTGLRGADLVAGNPPDSGAPGSDSCARWIAAAGGLLAAVCRGAVSYLLERSVEHAGARVQFASAFQDELGNAGIAKFGAVKHLLAQIAAHGYALDCARGLERLAGVVEVDARMAERVLGSLAFGPHEPSAAYNAGQVFGGTAISEDDVLAKYYRDSCPFRYLWGGIDALAATLAGRARARGRERALAGPTAEMRSRIAATGVLASALARWDAAAMWLGAALSQHGGGGPDDPADIRLGMAYAACLAAQAMLVRTQGLLEQGEACRMEVTATRLAADELSDRVRTDVDHARHAEALSALGAVALEGAMFEPSSASVSTTYHDVMHAKPAFRSGGFLTAPFDRDRVRYTPELRAKDPKLAAFDGRMSDYFRSRYYEADYGGMTYGRYLESRHQLAPDDVAGMHREGFLKVYIPEALGGLGLPKSYYYAMVEQSMRWADPSWTLVVMGNSSIGTTPIQIGLHQDLPRAVRELERVRDDHGYLGDIAHDLEALEAKVAIADDAEIARGLDALAALVVKRVEGGAILKYLAKTFTKPLRAAFAARSIDERPALASHLAAAREALLALGPIAVRRLEEFPRRARAHELFLKLIAHGQMSAFALTEPTAGSDSGGVKTLARYAQRRLERSQRGEWVFYADEKARTRPRVLLDADRLVFKDAAVYYRHADDGPPAALCFDAYDYETDATKTRYYVHAGERYEFHDLGQLRADEAGPFWAFYELTGTKMWITNGRICGVMCLYAKTPEGVTGFMVDRHAEGLVVGNDEEKLGQQGSPTNELSLASVRVAAENMIGYAGRGQVNALETLNVGRGGLCVSCAGIERDILHRSVATLALARPGTRERCELGRIATEWVTTQSISHELVGLFDAKAADAVRVESAIGKYWASESLHRAIGYEEDLRGLYGATEAFDVEKKRRDARVLNIYEGTNEVQRFLLLKDLSSYLLERHRTEGMVASRALAAGATPRQMVLENAKDRLFAALEAIVRTRGDAAWSNPAYQPTYFRLAEVAGQIKIADALEYRLHALAQAGGTGGPRGTAMVAALELALLRVHDGIERAFARFELSNGYLEDEQYPPEVQLGFQLLERATADRTNDVPDAALELDRPIEVAVVLAPAPRVAPVPRIARGQLREPYYELSEADRGALALALELGRRGGAKVRVTAVAVARPAAREALAQALALGAARAWFVPSRSPHPAGAEVGGAVLAAFDNRGYRPDLVLAAEPSDPACGAPGLGAYLASALDLPFVPGASRVEATAPGGSLVLAGDAGSVRFTRGLPAVLALDPDAPATLRGAEPASLTALVDAAGAELETIEVTGERDVAVLVRATSFGVATAVRRATDADTAAAAFLGLIGRTGGGTAVVRPAPHAGRPQPFDRQDALPEPAVLAWLAPAITAELAPEAASVALRARELARAWGIPLDVAVPVDADEGAEPALAGALVALGARRVYLVRQPGIARFSMAGHLALTRRFVDEYAGTVRALVGPASLEPVLAQLARRHRAGYWFGVDAVENGAAPPRLVTRILDGRAEAVAQVLGSGLVVLSARAGRATWPSSPPDGRCEVYADRLPLDYDPSTDPMARPAGSGGGLTLSNAEYVVDVGYALKSADDLARVALPLERLLVAELGLARSIVGATRKVTQDLKILPMDRQIGQTGVRVAPRALFALGVSGAPQHVDYIDAETVVFCFNQDPDSPLMQWNKDKPRPLVHPIAGDLFETVPRFIDAVRRLAGVVP